MESLDSILVAEYGRRNTDDGFSLLGIMLAVVIMSIMLTGVLTFYGSSQVRVRTASAMTIGTMLAREKMAGIMLEMEQRVAEGKFPETDEHKEEPFEAPYEDYRYELTVRKIEIPMPPPSDDGSGGAAGDIMSLIMKQLKLDEAVREVKLKILWDVRGRERSFAITTHVVKL